MPSILCLPFLVISGRRCIDNVFIIMLVVLHIAFIVKKLAFSVWPYNCIEKVCVIEGKLKVVLKSHSCSVLKAL